MLRLTAVPSCDDSTARDGARTARLTPEARAAELMAEARQLLHEVGYENFLPSELARRCAVSEGLIYRYFPTKRDLLSSITVAWFGEVLAVELELDQIPSADERLRHLLARGLELVKREPELAHYMFQELRSAREDYSSNSYALTRRYAGILERVLYDAAAAGEFRDNVDARLVRDMIFGAMEHWTAVLMRGEAELDVQIAADQIAGVIGRGMSAVRPPNSMR